jgi:aldehyde dehydrogenase (NAD+)
MRTAHRAVTHSGHYNSRGSRSGVSKRVKDRAMQGEVEAALNRLGLPRQSLEATGLGMGRQVSGGTGAGIALRTPIDGSHIGTIRGSRPADLAAIGAAAQEAFRDWRMVPAPVRGEFVRKLGERFRASKSELATLITWEVGKIRQEALGEVQEMIDICDFAVGLSRQLHGLTIASERPRHRLMEQWHPLGPVLVITAFNFPMAVWAWNAMLAWVCGDPVVWKPSEKTPLCAAACFAAVQGVLRDNSSIPDGIAGLVVGERAVGEALVDTPAFSLVSATGSVPMGRAVGPRVAKRFGRTLLELGGNNGMIIAPSADLELAIRAIVFGAVGTCGQRCTTLRRLFVHETRYDEVLTRLKSAYTNLPIGDPSKPGVLVGPLIDEAAFIAMQTALERARREGGQVTGGERVMAGVPHGGFYVHPAVVEIDSSATIVQEETFAPILYVMRYSLLDHAIAQHNGVPQGLSSAIVTNDVCEAELFCSPAGSDCGLVNVNCGTSGAEIGGAFGGEKETGGGRESGSDAWKNYMRRVTSTINWSGELPLAQGIQFEL